MKHLYLKIQILFIVAVSVFSDQKFFMKLFADAGIGISCPSGNRVYVHPISGDLQQCSQQLGVYNDKSCPGGTVCERFPIPIPGFQDFCCWEDDQKNSEEVVIGTTTSVPEEFFPYTEKPKRKIRPIVEAILEKPDDEDDEEIPPIPKEAIVNIIPEEESNSKDEDWEFETTRRTPRPRSRKVTTTTTTTTEEPFTTTRRPSGSKNRLLRCSNPDDTPFLDFGNRLRDCFPGYYQNSGCFRGYRCEFNKDIRRYICCGQGRDIVPPAGLPDIPQPKPLLPPRPFRPRQGPFNFNDGDQQQKGDGCPLNGNHNNNNMNNNENGCSYNNQNQNWGENGCSNNGNQNGNFNNFENGCPMNRGGSSSSTAQNGLGLVPRNNQNNQNSNNHNVNMNNGGNNNNNWNEQNKGCPMNNRNSNGGCNWNNNNGGDDGYNQPMIATPKVNSNQWGPDNRKMENNWNGEDQQQNGNGNGFQTNERGSSKNRMGSNQWNNGGSNGQWGKPDNSMNLNNNRPNRGMEKISQENNNWSSNFPMNNRGGDFNKPMNPGKLIGQKNRGTDYDYDYDNDNQWNKKNSNKNGQAGENGNNWKGGSPNDRIPTNFRSRKTVVETCSEGSEYALAGTVPKCSPPGTDSCPISHPRCLNSLTHGYFVCCL